MPERRLTQAALAVALLPFVVGAIVLLVVVRDSYLPISDHALIEMHVRDVGHNAPLVGLYSRENWSHPGPMLFYVLVPFYWLTGGASIALNLGALAINGASITGIALIARRRGGTTLMLCALLACALLMRDSERRLPARSMEQLRHRAAVRAPPLSCLVDGVR